MITPILIGLGILTSILLLLKGFAARAKSSGMRLMATVLLIASLGAAAWYYLQGGFDALLE
jgi:hypothetical protein